MVTEMYDAISLGITLAFYTSYQSAIPGRQTTFSHVTIQVMFSYVYSVGWPLMIRYILCFTYEVEEKRGGEVQNKI